MPNIVPISQYSALAEMLGVSLNKEFARLVHLSLKHLKKSVTCVYEDSIYFEYAIEEVIPTSEEIYPVALEILTGTLNDYSEAEIYEKTYENGALVRTSYIIPSKSIAVQNQVVQINKHINIDFAYGIGLREASGPYNAAYYSIYFLENNPELNYTAYALKIAKDTYKLLDIKYISLVIPDRFASLIPANAIKPMYGRFKNNEEIVDIYFSFNTEQEYSDYMGQSYIMGDTTLGPGTVCLTLNTTSNEVLRIKRYRHAI